MTTAIDDLRARLRIDLRDENGDRWPDEALDRHLQRAARELSLVWPREVTTTLQTAPGSREVDVASLEGMVRVEAVEFPAGRHPPSYVRFSLFGTALSLHLDALPAGADDVAVYWGGLHELDETGSTLPAAAEDIVVTGAAGYAATEWASFATNRANAGGRQVARDYLDWGERQLRRFERALAGLGTRSRLRTSRLYPARQDTGRGAVRWEG